MKISTVLFCFVCILGAKSTGACQNGWLTHDQSCYLFSHDTEPWYIAVLMCRDFGGQLVEIETQQENDFLSSQAKLYGSPTYWTALNDLIEEGTWVWKNSNTPLSESGFSNWLPNEPNNSGNDENCGTFGGGGVWNDVPCHLTYRYICEKSNEPDQVIG